MCVEFCVKQWSDDVGSLHIVCYKLLPTLACTSGPIVMFRRDCYCNFSLCLYIPLYEHFSVLTSTYLNWVSCVNIYDTSVYIYVCEYKYDMYIMYVQHVYVYIPLYEHFNVSELSVAYIHIYDTSVYIHVCMYMYDMYIIYVQPVYVYIPLLSTSTYLNSVAHAHIYDTSMCIYGCMYKYEMYIMYVHPIYVCVNMSSLIYTYI